MKITVEIAESLLAEAEVYTAAHSLTLRELLEEGLRVVLQKKRANETVCLRDGSFQGRGMQRDLSWPEIRERIYEGRGE